MIILFFFDHIWHPYEIPPKDNKSGDIRTQTNHKARQGSVSSHKARRKEKQRQEFTREEDGS